MKACITQEYDAEQVNGRLFKLNKLHVLLLGLSHGISCTDWVNEINVGL